MQSEVENFVTLRDVWVGRGEETPNFQATLYIRDRKIAHVSNRGTGGGNVYRWESPCTDKWFREKLGPLAARVASHLEPEFAATWHKYPREALDVLVFRQLEAGTKSRSAAARKALSEPVTPFPSFSQGDKVIFGRPNGEKTSGVVKKVNRKSLLVETEDTRGIYPKGTRFKVAPSLCTRAP